MIYFPKNEGTRLVQVRALSGEFPYYGNLKHCLHQPDDLFETDKPHWLIKL
jgi:hypothetical protein